MLKFRQRVVKKYGREKFLELIAQSKKAIKDEVDKTTDN